MKYLLLHAVTGQFFAAAGKLRNLWAILDEYTAERIPVVIVDKNDDILAGNILGFDETVGQGVLKLQRRQK